MSAVVYHHLQVERVLLVVVLAVVVVVVVVVFDVLPVVVFGATAVNSCQPSVVVVVSPSGPVSVEEEVVPFLSSGSPACLLQSPGVFDGL